MACGTVIEKRWVRIQRPRLRKDRTWVEDAFDKVERTECQCGVFRMGITSTGWDWVFGTHPFLLTATTSSRRARPSVARTLPPGTRLVDQFRGNDILDILREIIADQVLRS